MEKGKQKMGNEVPGETAVKTNDLRLYPVGPHRKGKGLPYAPVDWPSPGDTWRWRVGSRINHSGFYTDRFLFLPKRLRVRGLNYSLGSKSSLEDYIFSHFPDSDFNEFLNSFSWRVPSTRHHWSEDLSPQVPLDENVTKRRKEAPRNFKRAKKVKLTTSQSFPRCRTRQSYKIPAQANIRNDESVIDLCSLEDDDSSDGSGYSNCGSEPQIDIEGITPDQSIGSNCYASNPFKAPGVQKVDDLHPQFCEEDVEDCLESLEHILSEHNDEAQVRTPSACVGSDIAGEMSTHRKKLSSILTLDCSCLLSSNYREEISFSVEKLATDPTLTVDQLLKLKLVEEIPKASEVFIQTKESAKQVTKFFGDIQAMKDKVSSVKREFAELKKEEGELQSQVDSKLSLVREIDEEIAQLQSRKAELTHDLQSMNKAKDQVFAKQKILANSLSAVVREIQSANAQIPLWEMKKKTAEKRMAEILARYAPLKGFSFEKSG